MKNKTDTSPIVIGHICGSGPNTPAGIARLLHKHHREIAYLPFQVNPSYLNNIIKCMQIMDVHSISVSEKLKLHMAKHISRLGRESALSERVDTIVRHDDEFTGHDAYLIALMNLISQKTGDGASKTFYVVGTDRISKLLASLGWTRVKKLQKPSVVIVGSFQNTNIAKKTFTIEQMQKFNPSTVIVDVNDKLLGKRIKQRIGKNDIQKEYNATSFKLLTANLN